MLALCFCQSFPNSLNVDLHAELSSNKHGHTISRFTASCLQSPWFSPVCAEFYMFSLSLHEFPPGSPVSSLKVSSHIKNVI